MTQRSATPGAFGVDPTETDRQAVLALVRRIGEAPAVAHLGINRFTLARVAATLPVREGTLELVRARLAAPPQADPAQLPLPLDVSSAQTT
jgi:hypothetical protein